MMAIIRNVTIAVLLFSISCTTYASDKELIVAVEQTAGRVGFYDPIDRKEYGSVNVGFLPHEIAISKDQKTAYVSNFGLQRSFGGKSLSTTDLVIFMPPLM